MPNAKIAPRPIRNLSLANHDSERLVQYYDSVLRTEYITTTAQCPLAVRQPY